MRATSTLLKYMRLHPCLTLRNAANCVVFFLTSAPGKMNLWLTNAGSAVGLPSPVRHQGCPSLLWKLPLPCLLTVEATVSFNHPRNQMFSFNKLLGSSLPLPRHQPLGAPRCVCILGPSCNSLHIANPQGLNWVWIELTGMSWNNVERIWFIPRLSVHWVQFLYRLSLQLSHFQTILFLVAQHQRAPANQNHSHQDPMPLTHPLPTNTYRTI